MAQISAMDLSANGLHVVQGELCILLNSMRRPFKWSSQHYQVNLITCGCLLISYMKSVYIFCLLFSKQEEEQDVLLKKLYQLKENLYQVSSLKELDLLTVLSMHLKKKRNKIRDYNMLSIHFEGPFLEVIRSEDTTGPVTELALSSIFKFLSYGLIGTFFKNIATFHQI